MLTRFVRASLVLAAVAGSGCKDKAPAKGSAPGAFKSQRVVEASAPPVEDRRLYPRVLRAWVHAQPSRESDKLGYLRLGSSVKIAGPVAGTSGCAGGWYPVEPRGFACVGQSASLVEDVALVRAAAGLVTELSRRLQYIYCTVRRPGPAASR